MDVVLCDELLQEILQRLPPSSSPSLSLVSKRWLSLLRSSTTSLSLRSPSSPLTSSNSSRSATGNTIATPTLSSILSHYPFLTNLTIVSGHYQDDSADALLFDVAASACSGCLTQLRFLPDSPLSSSALLSCAPSFASLTSLQITSLGPPLSLRWLTFLPSLKSFSLVLWRPKQHSFAVADKDEDGADEGDGSRVLPLLLETLSLTGIPAGEHGLSWLWRRCSKLRWLQLRACEGTGDGPSSNFFTVSLHGLLGLELRTCRTIADRVLLHAANRCQRLTSLLLYDGGSRDALHNFIQQRRRTLRTLDLRLPLDLHNEHLFAIAANDRRDSGPGHLAALRLQSCCLVTGDGLRCLARAPTGAAIEELSLVNCDVVEREPGLLTFLGQSMQQLRVLDLSHNETLTDKEVGAMLASCRNLVKIRVRGCRTLTGAFTSSLIKYCGQRLEFVDITRCQGIGIDAVEIFVLNAFSLNQIVVEENKVSEVAMTWLSRRAIRIS